MCPPKSKIYTSENSENSFKSKFQERNSVKMYIHCISCSVQFNDEARNRRLTPEGACGGPVQEVILGEEQELDGAIVTATESDGKYPNNACQEWKITAAPCQVKLFIVCLKIPHIVEPLCVVLQ